MSPTAQHTSSQQDTPSQHHGSAEQPSSTEQDGSAEHHSSARQHHASGRPSAPRPGLDADHARRGSQWDSHRDPEPDTAPGSDPDSDRGSDPDSDRGSGSDSDRTAYRPLTDEQMTAAQMMMRIGEGIALTQQGDTMAARMLLEELWQQTRADQHLQRCAIAHALADVQADSRDELAWDLRALAAAGQVSDDDVREAGMPVRAAGLFPSLHLNLADVYARLGERDAAAEHLMRGRDTLVHLSADGYRTMISDALDRVADQLEQAA